MHQFFTKILSPRKNTPKILSNLKNRARKNIYRTLIKIVLVAVMLADTFGLDSFTTKQKTHGRIRTRKRFLQFWTISIEMMILRLVQQYMRWWITKINGGPNVVVIQTITFHLMLFASLLKKYVAKEMIYRTVKDIGHFACERDFWSFTKSYV